MWKFENNRKVVFVIWFVYILGMILTSCSTSFLYPFYYGQDSALFSLLGKAIVSGKTIYKDLFDHKGPILFFIQAFGWLLGGRGGIFLLQIIFGTVNIIFLFEIWKETRTENHSLLNLFVIFIIGYAEYFNTLAYGNLSEEYSLPFITGCIYLFIKYAKNTEAQCEHPALYSLLYGVAFAVLAFIRLNNAVTICAGVFVIMIYLIYKKKYKNLFINILSGITGFVLVAVPVIVYFYNKNALYDMIYATFIHNFKYVQDVGHNSIPEKPLYYAALYAPILISLFLTTKHIVSKKPNFEDGIVCFIFLVNSIMLFFVNANQHYFTIFHPVFMLVLFKYYNFNLKSIKNIFIYLCVALNLYYAASYPSAIIYNGYLMKNNEKENIYLQNTDVIPRSEKNSVIGYNIPVSFYLHEDIIPCHKYYTHQKLWAKSNPIIIEEFIRFLESDKPLWVLIRENENDEKVLKALKNNYRYETTEENIKFYRVKK